MWENNQPLITQNSGQWLNLIGLVISLTSLLTIHLGPIINQRFISPVTFNPSNQIEILPSPKISAEAPPSTEQINLDSNSARQPAVKGSTVDILQIAETINYPAAKIGLATLTNQLGKKIYHIHSQADLSSAIIYQAPEGTTFFVLTELANWYQVKFSAAGQTIHGWIYKEKQ